MNRWVAMRCGTLRWASGRCWLSGQASPVSLVGVDLAVLRGRLRLVGRARASLAAFEADLVGEITRQEGEAKAEEILRRDQKRSLAGARKAVKVAAQLEWMPGVAEKLAEGAITPEAASLIAEAAAETPVDQNFLLNAAEQQADDLFRRTLKNHINERTNGRRTPSPPRPPAPPASRFDLRTTRRHVQPLRPPRSPHRSAPARRPVRQSRRTVPPRRPPTTRHTPNSASPTPSNNSPATPTPPAGDAPTPNSSSSPTTTPSTTNS